MCSSLKGKVHIMQNHLSLHMLTERILVQKIWCVYILVCDSPISTVVNYS